MIRRCFSVFRGVGARREQTIRDAGISSWRQFLAVSGVPGLPEGIHSSLRRQVAEWSRALERQDARFFARNLRQGEHWRLFEAFGDSLRYIDIETTGLSAWRHDVTVVGIYDGQCYEALIRGRGLTAQTIRNALAGCKLLVSYFGTAFDVPFLRASFPGLDWDLPHFDLCFAGRRLGLTGGLKTVERTLGIARDHSIADIDGYEAVRLWRAHEKGDPTGLKKLIEYNEADTRNLAQIAPVVYEGLCREAQA